MDGNDLPLKNERDIESPQAAKEVVYKRIHNKLTNKLKQRLRQGEDDVALIAADELAGLLETANLLRSPANAKRLLATLERVRQGQGAVQSIEELRREVGLDPV